MSVTREQIETIAKRYGIAVSYVEPGNGGFTVDYTNEVYSSMVNVIKEMFTIKLAGNETKRSEYVLSNENLLAA